MKHDLNTTVVEGGHLLGRGGGEDGLSQIGIVQDEAPGGKKLVGDPGPWTGPH